METAKICTVDSSNAQTFIDSIDAFVFDCDGVLWDAGEPTPIEGVVKTMEMLRKLVKISDFI